MSRATAAQPPPPDLVRDAPDSAGTATPGSEDGRLVTEEVYWRDYYFESDIHYEWNNGRLEEKPVSDFGTFLVYQWLMLLLDHFLKARPMAKPVGLEMGFRLPLPTGTVIRKPDCAVVRNDNRQPLLPFDCAYHGVYDLCIEALSDQKARDIERDAVTKKAEYAAGGVPEYYILHQDPAHQAFYTRSEAGLFVPIEPDDGVIRSRILPGLQFRQADLCTRPAAEAMHTDPVYADFVLPSLREAEQRAAQAEAARQEAEVAMKEAEAKALRETEARHRLEQELEAVRRQLGREDDSPH